MRDISVCFSGHRQIPYSERGELGKRLFETLVSLYERGYHHFYAGGALGFDTLAAKTVLELKENYADVWLHLILPCKNQTANWNARAKDEYNEILSLADSISYSCESYVTGCMQLRNRQLVDSASVCVCHLKRESGGTAYTVRYAKQSGLEIINLI